MKKVRRVRANDSHRPADYAFRNRRGEERVPAFFTASEAKTEFGHVLETALREGAVIITKHDEPKAILLSLEDYNALLQAKSGTLDVLTDEFDALLERMQGPKARAAMKSAFDASPKHLGRAAVAVARARE
jgi:antitoxin Phd